MKRKNKSLKGFLFIIILILILIIYNLWLKRAFKEEDIIKEIHPSIEASAKQDEYKKPNEINDWNITLVNKDNPLPDNFEIKLANIDTHRQFDNRAIHELNQMLFDMRNSGASNIWVQSAYRSIEKQQNLFTNEMNKYISQGKSESEAEFLTSKSINRAGTSEHNLGLAVDFNYVNESFDKSIEFKWLLKNAENYGFILRYRQDKEHLTGIKYEPWHWRYVGKEHAKAINEKDFCLEEYVEYLSEL